MFHSAGDKVYHASVFLKEGYPGRLFLDEMNMPVNGHSNVIGINQVNGGMLGTKSINPQR
jgi:hypothetical protein